MKAKRVEPTHFSKVVRLDKPHISHSYLNNLKRALQGQFQFSGNVASNFGQEQHKRILEKGLDIVPLTDEEEVVSAGMIAVLDQDKRFQKALKRSEREVEVNFYYRDVHVLMFADILKRDIGFDYKTTYVTTESAFLKKARRDDYWRQAALYMAGTKRKKWEIIGQPKEAPHPLFWLPVLDYPDLMKEGIEELNILVDLHKWLRKYYESKL